MKAYTFNYRHDYSHGGTVVLAESYEEAKEQIFSNSENKDRVFILDGEDDYDKNKYNIDQQIKRYGLLLVFEKEVELNKAGVVYNYCDEC